MKVVGGLCRLREQPAPALMMVRIMLPMKDVKEPCCIWSIESKGSGPGRADRAIPHELLYTWLGFWF